MAILKVVRPLKVNGEMLQPGEMFRTSNEQLLLDRGYTTKHLTRGETRTILDEYVRYAKGVFSEKEVLRKSQVEYVQGTLI